MTRKSEVTVVLKSGKVLNFYVKGYEDYEALVREVDRIWSRWVCIGPGTTVRKAEIGAIFYSEDNDV